VRDRRGPIAAVLTVLAAGAVLAADTYAPAPLSPPEPAVVVAQGEPVGGSFVCGVGDATQDEVSVVAARPGRGGGSPARLELQRFAEGTLGVGSEISVFPGAASTTSYRPADGDPDADGGGDAEQDDPADEDGDATGDGAAGDGAAGVDEEQALAGTWVTWRDAPATAWREWNIDDHDGLPDATVAGACATPSSERWIVPGMSTEGGDEARLRLTNPFPGSATVALGFLTPDGAQEPLVLRNITVPAHSVREIVVNDTLPERADLSAVVEVSSGRMSVEGIQLSRSAIGGIDGASLLQAAPEVAEEWTVPWVSDDDATSSWLWIANPGRRTAPVRLALHTADGGELPEGLAEVSVPPGEMRRVDLTGTFPEDVTAAAVSARSDGAPIVVSAGTKVSADDPGATGVAVQLGASSPDRSWVLSGGIAGGRTEALHVVNPTGAEAVVDVALFNGVVSLQPAGLQDLEVGAGSSIVVELDDVLDERSAWSAFVTSSSGEVVVGRVGRSTLEAEEDAGADAADEPADGDAEDDGDDAPSASEALRLVAVPGVPSAAWSATGAALAAVPTEGLVRQLRTADGIGARPGPEVPETPAPDLDPDPDADAGPDVDPEPDVAPEPDAEPEVEPEGDP
jgi:hypothetical protein